MKISLLIYLIIIFISCTTFCILVSKSIIAWFKKRNLGKNIINSGSANINNSNETIFSWIMRNGVLFLNKPSSWLLYNINFIKQMFDNLVIILDDKGIKTSKEAVCSVYILFIFILGIACSILFMSLIAGLAIVLCISVCLASYIRASIDRKMSNIRNSIPDTLRSMSSCFGAGYTVFQTFDQISKESKGSIKKLFLKSSHVLQTGGSVSQSLDLLKKAKEAPELSFVAVALDVQHQTGGSMKPVLESAKDMVESKLELMRLLQVQTAQAKLSSRIVIIMPFALIAIFSIVSPGFLTPFFTSFIGIIMLAIAILMETAGIIVVKKMLNVKI